MNLLLRKINMFKDLSDSSLIKIDEIVEEKLYEKGEDIFFQGEEAKGVFFIKEGKVKIYKSSLDGKEHILHILESGEVFAEVCILNGIPYPASAKAIENSEVYIIENSKLEKLISENGDIAIELIKLMSNRLVMISKQVETIALKDSLGKVSSLIIRMLTEKGQEIKDGSILNIDISRQDMANMVSLTRESFTRTLSKLKDTNIIDINKDEIIIKDIKGLIEYIY
ncbi:Crp/Fnr family transcriptional regulator [Clostridium cylindrosporum]|uniref:Transcriptional regulator, Crp/Fnr family n=1 Tax=Clostridium cylindrosporum DSM 605 TaxID=1121307 RepID=A0A0J8D8I1_CLOCY|nr:Crp/Fnr family transcriptional regulator [Clostridium cylindrosporum]KMT22365.1 transcriptional regulator, Crp/Fnr family [Clostridium cylindrosporum DSM 605]